MLFPLSYGDVDRSSKIRTCAASRMRAGASLVERKAGDQRIERWPADLEAAWSPQPISRKGTRWNSHPLYARTTTGSLDYFGLVSRAPGKIRTCANSASKADALSTELQRREAGHTGIEPVTLPRQGSTLPLRQWP